MCDVAQAKEIIPYFLQGPGIQCLISGKMLNSVKCVNRESGIGSHQDPICICIPEMSGCVFKLVLVVIGRLKSMCEICSRQGPHWNELSSLWFSVQEKCCDLMLQFEMVWGGVGSSREYQYTCKWVVCKYVQVEALARCCALHMLCYFEWSYCPLTFFNFMWQLLSGNLLLLVGYTRSETKRKTHWLHEWVYPFLIAWNVERYQKAIPVSKSNVKLELAVLLLLLCALVFFIPKNLLGCLQLQSWKIFVGASVFKEHRSNLYGNEHGEFLPKGSGEDAERHSVA